MLQTSSAISCPRCSVPLKAVWSDKGIVIDRCEKCQGVWLDGGEVYQFSKDPARIHWALQQGLRNPQPTRILCPRCHSSMVEGGLLSDKLLIDHCAKCEGLWFDKMELQELSNLAMGGHKPAKEGPVAPSPRPAPTPGQAAKAAVAAGLPSLYIKSAGVLAILYGMLFLCLAVAAEAGALPIGFAVLLTLVIAGIQFAVSPLLMDWMFRWTLSLRWVERTELPPALVSFVEGVAKKNNIQFPRFGIIEDGTPTAFTYGHTPNNARIVVSRGLLEILDPDEVNGVVAHEIGHAVHWDMLVMTVAALVPIMLYYIFRVSIRMRGKNNPGPIIALAAYILYVISQYILLWLSRTREYYADQFAGEETLKPGALASALTKIAYGLAGNAARRKLETDAAKGNKEAEARLQSQDPNRLDAVRALGIFDPESARALVATSVSETSFQEGRSPEIDKEKLKDAMQWDLWNPWAGWYELHSTHPLPAKRIEALSDQAEGMGQKAFVRFDRTQPESYWDDFLIDLLVQTAPLTFAAMAFLLGLSTYGSVQLGKSFGLALAGLGLGSLISTLYCYRGALFPKASVAGLLKNVKVSAVSPVPATIHGKIIGKGIPGLIWSEDLVLQDSTGYIFLDYRQPLGIIEFMFGLFRAGGIVGREVTAVGWYRRAPVPYFELKHLSYRDGSQTKEHSCYVFPTKLVVEALMIVGGLIVMVMV